MKDHVEVRPGHYADSVTLMQASSEVGRVDGVEAAIIAMATELNRDLLVGLGFDVAGAGADDLVVAIRAADDAVVGVALATLAAALAPRRAVADEAGDAPPRTVAEAATAGGDLALISVPGEHAFVEAMDAIEGGLDVMLFSDNMPVAQEIVLKDRAATLGRLVMGPDAGTAIVAGVGLGFANVVRPGPVGLVAASGTGAQLLTCLLDAAGVGVSHVLGVGGRDLSTSIAGRATLRALELLELDAATEHIVVLSKPPAPDVAERIAAVTAAMRTPVTLALLGEGEPDLARRAEEVIAAVGGAVPERWPTWGERPAPSVPGRLVGLFSGGTLCAEATLIAQAALGDVRANVVVEAARRLHGFEQVDDHVLIDLGEDEFTRGRPHPMIDQRLRLDRIAIEGGRSRVLLLDVVLGHAAHPDPASELAPVLEELLRRAEAEGRPLDIVVSLCGTTSDPQGLERQATRLVEAGAFVALSNAEAARTAVAIAGGAS
jgi:FdrA protein